MMKSLLAALALTTAAAPAFADRPLPVVDASVTSVVFDRGTQTRAIAGGDREGAFLGIQRVVKGTITDETAIAELPIDGDNVPLTQLKNLRLLSLSGGALVFEVAPRVRGAKPTIQCTAQLAFEKRRVRIRTASCNDDGADDANPNTGTFTFTTTGDDVVTDAPPTHHRHRHDMADIEAATAACNAAFEYTSDRKQCIDLTLSPSWGRFASSVPAAIQACSAAFEYTSDRIACVQLASRSSREPVALINYCKSQNEYVSDRKACIEKFGNVGGGSVKL